MITAAGRRDSRLRRTQETPAVIPAVVAMITTTRPTALLSTLIRTRIPIRIRFCDYAWSPFGSPLRQAQGERGSCARLKSANWLECP